MNVPQQSLSPSRTATRTIFIVLFTVIAALFSGSDIALPWHPYATYGFSATQSGVVTSVDADAARRGLRVGDRIEVAQLTPRQRLVFGSLPTAPDGATMRVQLASGASALLRSHAYPRSLADNVSDVILILAEWAIMGIAAALVLLRPMPTTWAFYAFTYFFVLTATLAQEYLPLIPLLVAGSLVAVGGGASAPAFFSFALRFPDRRPSRASKAVERFSLLVVAPLLMLWNLVVFVAYVFAAYRPPDAIGLGAIWLLYALFGAAILTLLVRYGTAEPLDRNRLRWVVASFAVAYVPGLIVTFGQSQGFQPAPWVFNCAFAWQVVAPIALAYTVLKHRLFDIRFVFSRALLYTVMMSFTVGVLALADWGFGAWLAQSRFALVAEIALALILGVTMTHAHKRLERLLNGVIFRAQSIALQALRRFAQETDLIPDPEHLLSQTYDALRIRLESEYAAVYTAEGGSYALSTPATATTPLLLGAHDFAVLRLKRWHEAFECDEPEHPLRGALMLPMTARGQLVGFVVCGPKRDHTHYLPEEVETLTFLTHRMGSAFALLTLAAAPLALREARSQPAGA